MKQLTDSRLAAQIIGPRQFCFGHFHGAGGRQHAHPQPRSQYQNRVNGAAVRTFTANGFRHFGQSVEVGTFGLLRGIRPNG